MKQVFYYFTVKTFLRFSDAINTQTRVVSDGVGMKYASKIKVAISKIEDDLSIVTRDVDDRRTRESYKDKHKSKSFEVSSYMGGGGGLFLHFVV